jgi:hypothetical protein
MVAKYDSKALMPMLLVVFLFQNPRIETPFKLTIVHDDDSIFGVVTSNEDTIHGLLKNELTLFHHLHLKPKDCALPLTWWQLHEARFPTFHLWHNKSLGFMSPRLGPNEFSS